MRVIKATQGLIEAQGPGGLEKPETKRSKGRSTCIYSKQDPINCRLVGYYFILITSFRFFSWSE